MKSFIKVFIVVITIILFTNSACRKADKDWAVITGFDARMCACCGGLMINFDGETQLYAGNFYLISNEPASLGIDNNAQFPLYAEVSWELVPQGCNTPHPYINVTKIVIR